MHGAQWLMHNPHDVNAIGLNLDTWKENVKMTENLIEHSMQLIF